MCVSLRSVETYGESAPSFQLVLQHLHLFGNHIDLPPSHDVMIAIRSRVREFPRCEHKFIAFDDDP